MPTAKGQKRKTPISSGNVDRHATSSDTHTPPGASLKNPGKKAEVSSSVTLSAPTEVPFNPKSILPVSKPQKSLSKLLETSASANKHIRSQSCSFACIDGSVRQFDYQSSTYSVVCEEGSPASASTSQQDVSTQLPSTSSESTPQREQFKAFGIEAFPTKAVLNELCYDFVSTKRWCHHGSNCYRIHPLHKSIYLSTVITESVLLRIRRTERDRMESIVPELGHRSTAHENTNASHIQGDQAHVKLPHTQNSTRASGSSNPSRTSNSLLKAREVEADSWNITHDMRKPPWADHAPSDTSSSSNGSDDGEARLWEPHSSPEDWLAATETPVASTSAQTIVNTMPTVSVHPSAPHPPVSSLSTHIERQLQAPSSNTSQPSRPSYQQRPIHPLPPRPSDATPHGKHYRPKNNARCRRWLRDECQLGFDCPYVHDDLDYDVEEPTRVDTQIPQVQASQRSQAPRMQNTHQVPQSQKIPQASQEREAIAPIKVKHPRPKFTDRCRRWLMNDCPLGYDCRWVHDDLEYDDDDTNTGSERRRIPESFSFTLHDHMRLRVGPGFEVEEITTGFESKWVIVGNLPYQLQDRSLALLMCQFGDIVEIRRVNPPTARVQFSKPSEAYTAFTTLHGVTEFGKKLELRMAVETKVGGSFIKDTAVRIDWDAPHRNVYMGYESMDAANVVVAKARLIPYEDFMTQAGVHIGMPAVGMVTVKFSGVPVHVTEEKMEELYGPHQGMVTERPNYKDFTVEDTINGVKKLLNQFRSKIVDVEFRPPPYKDGKMRAWVHFNTLNDAKAAAENLNGRKPIFTGHTRIIARHIKTIQYTLSYEKYHRASSEIRELSDAIWRRGGGYSLTTTEKMSHFTLQLCGEDMQILRRLKAEVERTVNGELLLENNTVAWDDFFGRPPGYMFLQDLERNLAGVRLERDSSRRTVRLFGVADLRARARERILEKIGVLRAQKAFVIPLDGRLAHSISNGDYQQLQSRLGVDNVMLDLWNRLLRIRGDQNAFDIAQDVVNAAKIKHQIACSGRASLSPSVTECPVCFNEPSNPVRLECGHSWCRGCLHRYFIASIDQKFFPLTCLGNEAKCKEPIALFNARAVLNAGELNAVVNAAFAAYVQAHAMDYHYCPTPDCSQVYRSAPEGVFIQCPSCLVRICPSCHKDAHDGQACSEVKTVDELFQAWVGKHDVKQCPGCNITIEKDEGCNHMMCTMCRTHVCWVCMKTFPNGQGIYAHMQGEHGDFGLGPMI